MIERLERHISEPERKILRELRNICTAPLFLVGGPVRDLLLGRKIVDLDFAVEGGIDDVSCRLAETFGGKVTRHPKFCTSKISFHDHVTVDLAETRTETYPMPARLPEVKPGAAIINDLARRDFSIQAMALRMNGPQAGQIVDPFNGRADLKKGTIRILHPKSFQDDPVRAFRACRYAARYEFGMDPLTEKMLRDLIGRPHLLQTARDRIFDEWKRTFEEEGAVWIKSLRNLSRRRLLVWAGVRSMPRLNSLRPLDAAWKHFFQKNTKTPPPELWITRWTAFLGLLAPKSREKIVSQMPFPKSVKKIFSAAGNSARILNMLASREEIRPSRLACTLSQLPPEWIAALYARSGATGRRRLDRYWRRWKDVQPPVTGEDLKRWGVPPGPVYPKLLRKLHGDFLDGLIITLEDARRVVLRLHSMK